MSLIPLNSNLTAQRIAEQLGIEDYNQASDIKIITEGFHTEAQLVNEAVQSSLSNMFIQTANETYLNIVGTQEGVIRVKDPTVQMKEAEEAVYLLVEDDDYFSEVLIASGEILPKNSVFTLPESNIKITILKDIPLDTLKPNQNLYIPCILTSLSSNRMDLSSGTVINLPIVPEVFRAKLRNLRVGFNRSISIQVVEEDLDSYRERLIYAKSVPKYATSTAIKIAINSNTLVSQYFIDYETYPFNVIIFNSSMLHTPSYGDMLEEYSAPQILSAINDRKVDGTDYTVNIAKAVNFNVEAFDNEGNKINIDMIDFRDFISSLFILGNSYVINADSVQMYLESRKREEVIELLVIYKVKDGFRYRSKDPEIFIGSTEYPHIEEVNE